MRTRSLPIAGLLLLAATIVAAQPAPAPQDPNAPQAQPPEEPPVYEEQVVVTATRTEQKLVNAPATVSLISSQSIANAPAQTYGDLLRSVPGVNVTQTSARDINITSRGASSTLSTSQLALMDGRSLYQDFFGFVAWDFLPVNLNEIKQIEVIRGPASAVWGASAMSGVINVITKSPREINGGSFSLTAGTFDRSVKGSDQGAGTMFSIAGSWAQAVNDRWAYKVSGGGSTQDAFARPTGTIPNSFNTPYPAFKNQGTTQPKFDLRVDYDHPDGQQKVVFGGGIAGTEGLIHTGIGPFDMQSGTTMAYAKVNYSRKALKLNFFTNILDGEANNLLAFDINGNPIKFIFKNKTYDFEFGNVVTIGTRNVISYGGNYRRNNFDLSLAPRQNDRNEGGFYIQDEIFLSEHFRWIVGGRVDKFDSVKDWVFSPRTTLMFKPAADHTFRVSFNRAFRAPSLVNNYLETAIVNQLNLGLINPALNGVNYNFPVSAVGNENLKQEELTAYEIGYSGVIARRATLSAAVYWNSLKNPIFFRQVASYRASAPPPRWPLPAIVLEGLIAANAFGPGQGLPSVFSYENLGKQKDKGFELGLDVMLNHETSMFANYSYQAEPETIGFPLTETNLPPTNRFNAGINYNGAHVLGAVSVNYQDDAFWQDVLDARYNGTTEAMTITNASFGIKWRGDKFVTSVKVNNLFNEDAQYHIFGDIIKRAVVGELRVQF